MTFEVFTPFRFTGAKQTLHFFLSRQSPALVAMGEIRVR